MTHEQFITLETARLAKQTGFDWECPTFYTETFDYTNQDGTGKFEFRRNDNLRYRNPNDDRNSFVNHKGTLLEYKFEMHSAPTQAVLQRWLRESKGIYIEVYHVIVWVEGGNLGIKWCYRICYLNSNKSDILSADEFNTYEAAHEAGLQKCLTLIEKKQ